MDRLEEKLYEIAENTAVLKALAPLVKDQGDRLSAAEKDIARINFLGKLGVLAVPVLGALFVAWAKGDIKL
jgi:hypothetical protein